MKRAPLEVGLFVTCLVDAFRPTVGFAAVKLLEEAGCRVSVPEAQTCCGQPAYNSGDRADALAIAKAVIAAFRGFDYVVVPSGSCGGMLKLHYPALSLSSICTLPTSSMEARFAVVLLLPAVKVAVVNEEFVMMPEPVTTPFTRLKPFKSSVPAVPTTNEAFVAPNGPVAPDVAKPALVTPLLMTVPPVYKLRRSTSSCRNRKGSPHWHRRHCW